MNEAQFLNSIDCVFPYTDFAKAMELVNSAISISENAIFGVLEEICRPPAGANVPQETLMDLIDGWIKRVDHALAKDIASIARLMIEGDHLSSEEAKNAMRKIAPFKGLYTALNIVYFACDDADGSLESFSQHVLCQWECEH